VNEGADRVPRERIDQLDPAGLVKRGHLQVMEGRHCFQHLTVGKTC